MVQSDAFDEHNEVSGIFKAASQKTLLIRFDGPRKGMRIVLN